jgi:hypothetical protein
MSPAQTDKVITLRELLVAYLETLTPQVHPIMTDHVQKTLASFEAALGVKIPLEYEDVPKGAGPLYMLFRSTVASLRALRTPTSGFLEASLLFKRLDESGERGQTILRSLGVANEQANALRECQLDILEHLLQIFLGVPPSVTMEQVRATGLYPGDTPKDFDIFEQM